MCLVVCIGTGTVRVEDLDEGLVVLNHRKVYDGVTEVGLEKVDGHVISYREIGDETHH